MTVRFCEVPHPHGSSLPRGRDSTNLNLPSAHFPSPKNDPSPHPKSPPKYPSIYLKTTNPANSFHLSD